MEDIEKELIFVNGEISYFNYKEPFDKKRKPTLYFKGEKDGQPFAREIKLGRYVKGFDKDHQILLRRDYPKYDHVYKADLQLETWEWEGHNCMRVIAFHIAEDLGKNKYLENPFNA